jgi:glycosyltransferase involved in cell wall biosynthesis
LISIVLPTFNRLEFLSAAISSVFAQTLADWELIIADDGSGAETRAYLQSLHNLPRVKLLYLKHTGNPAKVRNAALLEAQGEYVAFMDSDDLWITTKLETQIASLRRHAMCGWSYTKFGLIDSDGNEIPWIRRRGGWPTPKGFILDHLVTAKTSIVLPSVVASRILVEQVGSFNEELRASEDYDLFLRLAAKSEVDAIEVPLTLVRRHTQHYSGHRIATYQDNTRILEALLRTGSVDHLRPVLQGKLAELSVGLARTYSIDGERTEALRIVFSSARRCWPYKVWWVGALCTFALLVTPQAGIRLLRKVRRKVRATP